MSAELQPVRAVFRGWREEKGTRKITRTEFDGAFPSVNDIGITARLGKAPNWPYTNAKLLYGIMLDALLREPDGSEYEFIKPDTKSVRCILPIERDGDLPTPAGFILVEGRCVYPTKHTIDQGNVSGIITKFVGDTLQRGGHLTADDWTRFNTGNFERGLNTKKPAYTELMFFPAPDRLVLVDEAVNEEALF